MNAAQKRKIKLKTINKIHWKLPKSYQVPFDREGNLPFYPVNSFRFTEDGRYIENNQTYRWKDIFEFEDTLQYDSCEIGSKTMHFNFHSITTNCKYSMFLVDFLNTLKKYNFKKGLVKANWTFVRISNYYGVVPVNLKRGRKPFKNKGIKVSKEIVAKRQAGNANRTKPNL